MSFNYNFNDAPDYDLNASLIDEVINLYGVLVKFLKVQHINTDDIVFKDYSSIKTDSSNIFEIYLMPENTESWENTGYAFSQFNMIDMNNINMFCSKFSIESMSLDVKNLIGNLVVLPNNKIMEITNFDFCTPGVYNLFTFNNAKSVYKLTLIPYNVKINDELNTVDILHKDTAELGETSYKTLDKYFDELINIKNEQDFETEIKDTVKVIQKTGSLSNIDIVINKPIINREEDDVFGNF
jgi:hypothetical protein